MSVGSDPDGGYLVAPTLSTGMTKIMLEISPFIGLAREVKSRATPSRSRSTVTMPKPVWVGELGSRGETDSRLRRPCRCRCTKIQAEPEGHAEARRHRPGQHRRLAGRQGRGEVRVRQTNAYFNGNGVEKVQRQVPDPRDGRHRRRNAHLGRDYDTSRPAWTDGVRNSDDCPRPRPISLINLKIEAEVADLAGSGAVVLMNRRDGWLQDPEDQGLRGPLESWVNSLLPGQPDMLLGHPVIECERDARHRDRQPVDRVRRLQEGLHDHPSPRGAVPARTQYAAKPYVEETVPGCQPRRRLGERLRGDQVPQFCWW